MRIYILHYPLDFSKKLVIFLFYFQDYYYRINTKISEALLKSAENKEFTRTSQQIINFQML